MRSWPACPTATTSRSCARFGTYTADLQTLADWFVDRGIQTVAMESTGVYWIPLFEALEARGLHCCLISAQSIKRVPGRKSDVLDCQWIQTLHSYGLLSASFRPDADFVALRTLLRHRAQLLEHRAPHVLHMQKALLQMNIQLSQALSDVTGDTGQRIIRAIVAGERDPQHPGGLAQLPLQEGCGRDRPGADRHLARGASLCPEASARPLRFLHGPAQRVRRPDRTVPSRSSSRASSRPPTVPAPAEVPTPPRRKPHSHSKNAPAVNTRAHILRITGVDLVAVHGISDSLAQTILAEIGTDMRKWPDDKHFCSWLGLAPKNDISGGKVLKSRTMKNRNRAAQAFRMAAQSVIRSALCLWGLLSAPERAAWSRPGPRSHGAQDRPYRLSHAQAPGPVSRHRSRRV